MSETQPARLDVFSDAICPWCYIGKRQLDGAQAMLAREGLRFAVTWRPFQLNPDMPPEGVARDGYRAAKFGSLARSRELDAQVAEAAGKAGITIRHDLYGAHAQHARGTPADRRAARDGRQDGVVEALFAAYFAEGRDIGDLAVLAEIGAACGIADAAAILASDEDRAEVLAGDRAARAAGLSGVPTFALERHVLFSGAVPAETMAEALREAHRILCGPARAA